MRKLMLLLMILCLALPCAAMAEQDVVIVYNNDFPWPVAALLPGVETDVQWANDSWTVFRFPDRGEGSELGRTLTSLNDEQPTFADAVDPMTFPAATVLEDNPEFSSVDQCLGMETVLHKGDTVHVFGRCGGYWYVVTEGGEYGSLRLDSIEVDAETAALLNGAVPGFAVTDEEVQERFVALDSFVMTCSDESGSIYTDMWPVEMQAEYARLAWEAGYYYESWYPVLPPEDAVSKETVIGSVKDYIRDVLTLDIGDETCFGASYLLKMGSEEPDWHVFWHLKRETIDFTVGDGILVDYAHLYNCYESSFWTQDQMRAISVAAGWSEDTSAVVPEGMISEEDARELGFRYAAEQDMIQSLDEGYLRIWYFAPGEVPVYDWERGDWCSKAVWRVNIYSNEDDHILAELWFDAATGELYRCSAESSGMG